MTDKMREEFEAWAITSAWMGLSGECLEFIDGGYVNCEVQAAWLGWQASREALVIDLPKVIGSLMYSSDVYEAVEAAGLKVKS